MIRIRTRTLSAEIVTKILFYRMRTRDTMMVKRKVTSRAIKLKNFVAHSYHNHFILIEDSDDATSKSKPQRGRPRKRQKLNVHSSEDSDSSSDDDFLVKKIKETKTEKRGRGRPRIIRTPSEEARIKKRKIGQFKCPHCVKFFTRSNRVAAHIKTRHGFKCDVCNER